MKESKPNLHALARVSQYLGKSYLELTMTFFVMSHFSYCPLVRIFHDRKSYKKINKVHERTLRIICRDSTANFEELLIDSNSVPVHQKNLQLLFNKICRTIDNLNPSYGRSTISNL